MKVLNINALYKELIKRGNDSNYVKVHSVVHGKSKKGVLSDKEKRELLSIIDESVKTAKANILKS